MFVMTHELLNKTIRPKSLQVFFQWKNHFRIQPFSHMLLLVLIQTVIWGAWATPYINKRSDVLSLEVSDISQKIRKTLRDAVLFRMQHTTLFKQKDKETGGTCFTSDMAGYLFPHWLEVGNCCWEKSIPFQTSVKSGPVVVSVTRVRKTPRNVRVVLFVQRIALSPFGARTNSSHCSA